MTRDQFLSLVAEYVKQDPEVAAHVAEAARQGVSAALSEANARAADMETALSVSLARRYKGADALIHDKLKKWEGRTSLNWSHVLPNILLVRMRVYLVGPVKTRTVNYLYAKNLSAFYQIHHLEKRACAFSKPIN